MQKRFFESKKGISVMVGYVLLIVFLIIIGGIVYVWLKTYIPKQALECPDGTSLFMKEASFDSGSSELILIIKNNGRFDVAGYFIHAANSSEQEIPTIDLSGYLDVNQAGVIHGNSVLFIAADNLFKPGAEATHVFDIPDYIGELYSVRLIPTRFQESDGKERFASCGDCRVEQIIGEPYICLPDTCAGLDYNCGDWWSDGCGGTLDCGSCTGSEVCNSSGQCVDPGDCADETCDTYGYECGNWTICGTDTDCGNCSEYGSGYTCNATGQCETSAGNGVCDAGETCEDADCEGEQDGCDAGQICQGGICQASIPPGVEDCSDYCVWLGYADGNCAQNCGGACDGICEDGGDVYCYSPVTECCCLPAGPVTLFEDDFEGYTYTYGTNLYNEMASNGWEVFDEGQQDDIYLKDDYRSYDESYVVVRDDSSITASIDTTGYGQITLEYVRRTYSMPYGDNLVISWRVGTSGDWTELEQVRSDTWTEKQWSLTGADNQATIQIRFFGEGDNDDYSYIDNVIVNGTAT